MDSTSEPTLNFCSRLIMTCRSTIFRSINRESSIAIPEASDLQNGLKRQLTLPLCEVNDRPIIKSDEERLEGRLIELAYQL
jgi:hypothetical protein